MRAFWKVLHDMLLNQDSGTKRMTFEGGLTTLANIEAKELLGAQDSGKILSKRAQKILKKSYLGWFRTTMKWYTSALVIVLTHTPGTKPPLHVCMTK